MKQFDSFRLDVVNQCLWHDQTRLSLMPKPFAVLRYLVEHAGRLVTQDELLGAIWPETYVQPEVLRKYILEIRRALGDQASQPRFIATFPKRGYEFIARVAEDASRPRTTGAPSSQASRLVGREKALAQLEDYLRSAQSSDRQIVFITGDPGIGKTSLVDALVQSVGGDPAIRVARGHSVEGFGGKEAYYPMLAALAHLFRSPAGRSSVDVLATHAPTWLMQFPALLQARRRESLREEMLGATRERMLRELCEALDIITEKAILVLVLEDLHWADPATLDLLSAIARQRGPAKLIVLGTYRPVDVILSESPLKALKQDLLVHRLCHELALDRLDEADVAAYLSGLAGLGGPTGEVNRLAALIHQRSDGIPLFMTAMVEHLVQKDVLAFGAPGLTIKVPLERVDPVPETLKQMLQVQLEELPEAEQETLTAASVVGDGFTSWTVALLQGIDTAEAERRCGALSDRQQVLRWVGARELPDGRVTAAYEFKHALYREVLYRRLQPTLRAALHHRLAIEMETMYAREPDEAASELAMHFEEARDYERAIPHLIVAASRASRRYAHPVALTLLEHARALLQRVPSDRRSEAESQVLQRIGDTYYALGDLVDSAAAYEAAAACAAHAGLPVAEMHAQLRLAHPTAVFAPDRAISACERAAEIARQQMDPVAEARARLLSASWRILLDGWRRVDSETCAHAMNTIRSRGGEECTPHEHVLYSHVQFLQGDFAGACETAEAALRGLTEADGLWEQAAGLTAKAVGLLHLGQCGEARRTLSGGLELAKKSANALWDGILSSVLATVHLQMFDFETVRELSKGWFEAAPDRRLQPVLQLQMAPTWGFAELALGEHHHARTLFETVLHHEGGGYFLHWYGKMVARLGLAETWLASGDLLQAENEAGALTAQAWSWQNGTMHALACDLTARIAMVQGNARRAEQCVRKGLATLGAADIPIVAWRLHATAQDVYRRLKKITEAERQRSRAAALVLGLANSCEEGDPLRLSLLAAEPVRLILRQPISQVRGASDA